MAAELLATGSTAANSSDLTVSAGTPVTVGLKGWVTDAKVYIYLKDDAAAYNLVGKLTAYEPATSITAPGTYRFSRVAGASCGVFSA
ncbi:MAG: hypothetical protein EOS04_24270 [Mesorhizobium sp.]|nr:MAG: hypothetical protein EOR98_26610 [Mesorhizobium sp.]RWN73185.1 MAG: hypothetical protein EOS01_26945 [Mesorhizobium sp.]RWN85161.1 MAG: hypothetical protein EOS04_24270 [Mesorhizobium sp.]